MLRTKPLHSELTLVYLQGEQALCLQLVHLKNTRNPDVLLPLLAVGTGPLFSAGSPE
jgi:hypothetical protein